VRPRAASRAAGSACLLLLALGCAAGQRMAAAPAAPEATPAHAILAKRCANCHRLPEPARMSRDRWLRALDRMRRRVRLPEAEWDTLATLAAADSAGAAAPAPGR